MSHRQFFHSHRTPRPVVGRAAPPAVDGRFANVHIFVGVEMIHLYSLWLEGETPIPGRPPDGPGGVVLPPQRGATVPHDRGNANGTRRRGPAA